VTMEERLEELGVKNIYDGKTERVGGVFQMPCRVNLYRHRNGFFTYFMQDYRLPTASMHKAHADTMMEEFLRSGADYTSEDRIDRNCLGLRRLLQEECNPPLPDELRKEIEEYISLQVL
jgi:hypothetical protein